MEKCDVLVSGAGAAGLMTAIEAARRGRRVLLIDHARAAGEKIRISGGGRCNFTNLDIRADRFLSQEPAFCAVGAETFYPVGLYLRGWIRPELPGTKRRSGSCSVTDKSTQIIDFLLRDLAGAGGELWLDCALGRDQQDRNGI